MTSHPTQVVIVGASLAGLHTVRGLRRRGFTGRIVLVGDEPRRPYDRPPLSKDFLLDADSPTPDLADASEWASLDVDARLGVAATGLDTRAGTVTVAGETLPYDALVLATGLTARTLPGRSLAGVHTLRRVDDARAIRTGLGRATSLVVVGAGFIGSEVASAAHRRGIRSTILEAALTPLEAAVGRTAGAALAGLHTRHGVDLHCDAMVSELIGADHVEAVRLTDGEEIPADLVVVGIGATPATHWLAGSGLEVADGVVCDATLRAAPSVWAAGDIARWPHPTYDRMLRLEHWTNAVQQGDHVAANLLDPARATAFAHIPYFWSEWYRQVIQSVGLPVGEPTLADGHWAAEEFLALYRLGDRLAGALTLNRRADSAKYRGLIARGAGWDEALDVAATRRTVRPPSPARFTL